jgi:hypothetical protein
MFLLAVENERGERLELTHNNNYDVISVEGLNPPTAAINTANVAGLDGSRFNSSKIEQRNIVITLNIRPHIEANRLALYRYIRVKRYIKVYYKNDFRDVFIEGFVESFENNLFTQLQQPQISIICPNPFWRSTRNTLVDFSNLTALFEFPFSIPSSGIEFSRINKVTMTLINAGDVETGAVIKFHASAAVTNPVFYNRTNGTFFGFNLVMIEGDEITLNTLQGEKSVILTRENETTNILSSRQSGSSWITFEPGENEISFGADDGSAALTVTVIAVQKYEGV